MQAFVTGFSASGAAGRGNDGVAAKSHIRGAPHVTHARRVARVATLSMGADRVFFVGGNWKCNGSKSEIKTLVESFNKDAPTTSDVEVVVGAPLPYLEYTRGLLRSDWGVSAQNCWIGKGGAYTGEVTADMLADVGTDWVILGHSERRNLPELKESDATIATKTVYAISKGVSVMYCIGELLEERESGQTIAVCERQLKALGDVIGSDWSKIVIAYEPVWAIGTGKVATPEQAEEVHEAIRKWLAANVSQQVADSTRILYGGSVSPANCDELAKKPNIDGFLVGGASLKPDFVKIVESYKQKV
ncbi:Triosephosphate isomerase, cytosolic [Porphyridium purpureum]|uniref:Triosephosphate isomerase n=1 Tax=Porphyridium purpureum TaxID=35688 RepID=A0A5J4YZW8_PORPP|nr:Triosephosphate isomerase, cytosolic [Porphyridium purpureum]|eukprot:POR9894..scf208_2